MTKVALVTGANRGLFHEIQIEFLGIGFALVRALCKDFDGDVILTARDEERGRQAVDSLKSEGLSPKFHQLDITNPHSISNLKDFIQETYGGIDVIIQNAGIVYPPDSEITFGEQAETLTRVNNFGAENFILSLLPLMRPHARIVVIAGAIGLTSSIPGEDIRKRLDDPDLTVEGLNALQNEYIQDVKANKWKEKGWPEWSNATSKVCLVTFTKIIARRLTNDPREDILINAICPGWVATESAKQFLDMFQGVETKEPDEAADDIMYLVKLPQGTKEPHGKLVKYGKVLG